MSALLMICGLAVSLKQIDNFSKSIVVLFSFFISYSFLFQ